MNKIGEVHLTFVVFFNSKHLTHDQRSIKASKRRLLYRKTLSSDTQLTVFKRLTLNTIDLDSLTAIQQLNELYRINTLADI